MRFKSFAIAFAALASLILPIRTASAAPLSFYQVTFDTSALVGQGTFSLDFQLTDGSGTNDGNSTVTLSNFDFGGGIAGFGSVSGGATGDVITGVTMTDNSFFNEFLQDFLAGNSLSFTLGLSTTGETDPSPDLFTLAILQGGIEIPTLGVASEFLSSSMIGDFPQGFASDTSLTSFDIPAPEISEITQAPEPASLLLLGTGLMGVLRYRRRHP